MSCTSPFYCLSLSLYLHVRLIHGVWHALLFQPGETHTHTHACSSLPGSWRQPFNSTDAFLLAWEEVKKKKKVMQLDFRALEIPGCLPQTWHAPCPLGSPFICSNCSRADLSAIDRINPSIESKHPCGCKAHFSIYSRRRSALLALWTKACQLKINPTDGFITALWRNV